MQSKKESIIEGLANQLSGFVIAWFVSAYLLPLYGFQVTGRQSFEITLIFTIVSLIRSYVWRRYFNHRIVKRYGLVMR